MSNTGCIHRWHIDEKSIGTCLLCGEMRQYSHDGSTEPLILKQGGKQMKQTQGKTEVQLQSLAGEAMSQLSDFFRLGEHGSKDIAVARVSTAIISAWTRYEQTKGAERATMFMVARELASDKEQLAQYISETMPEMGMLKALPTKS